MPRSLRQKSINGIQAQVIWLPKGFSVVRTQSKEKKTRPPGQARAWNKNMETAVRSYSRTVQIVEVILKVYVLTHSHAFARHSGCQVRPTCNNGYVEKLWVVFVMLYRPVSMKKKKRKRESAKIDSKRRRRRRNYVCMYFIQSRRKKRRM